MKLSFRWYGADDKVTLENIRQIPKMEAIVTAVYDVPVGEVWSEKSIADLKKQVEENGLKFEVIESIPVHEDIKLGKPDRDRYIENYCENIKKVAKAGVKCICYNFMPVFDWTRTQLDHRLPDGSTTLVYYQEQVDKVDPLKTNSDLTLPGWDASYSREELKGIVAEYQKLSEEDLWNNLEYFLKKIIPVAAEYDVNMAIHEDDPCWSIFGLPRIITDEKNLDRFLKLVDDRHNGITLCTGSLGCSGHNDVAKMAAKYAAMGRIHFVHMRNVKILDNGFQESAHPSSCGTLDMYAIAKALAQAGGKVALLDLNQEAAKKAAKEISEEGYIAKGYAANVLQKESLAAAHEQIKKDFGLCDILINGAGGNNPKATTDQEYYVPGELKEGEKSFFDLEQSGVEFVFNLNFIGTLLPTQEFAQDMLEKEGCNIINISSMNAYTPLTKIPAYSGAKAAVSNFTEWLAVHFSKSRIRVNGIAPGFFATKQNRELLFEKDGTPTPRTGKILAATPLGRFGESEELIGTLLFLLNNEASGFITGVVIPVDGGFQAYSGV